MLIMYKHYSVEELADLLLNTFLLPFSYIALCYINKIFSPHLLTVKEMIYIYYLNNAGMVK